MLLKYYFIPLVVIPAVYLTNVEAVRIKLGLNQVR
jgi:hypothetical protein